MNIARDKSAILSSFSMIIKKFFVDNQIITA